MARSWASNLAALKIQYSTTHAIGQSTQKPAFVEKTVFQCRTTLRRNRQSKFFEEKKPQMPAHALNVDHSWLCRMCDGAASLELNAAVRRMRGEVLVRAPIDHAEVEAIRSCSIACSASTAHSCLPSLRDLLRNSMQKADAPPRVANVLILRNSLWAIFQSLRHFQTLKTTFLQVSSSADQSALATTPSDSTLRSGHSGASDPLHFAIVSAKIASMFCRSLILARTTLR